MGWGAVEQALDPAVRLILIDVMMPKLDGLSALMRIRKSGICRSSSLSAKSEDTDKILGLSMGADDYVTKPYNPQELARPGTEPAAPLHPAGRCSRGEA